VNAWDLFFSWPAGGTWSNLAASLEWAIIVVVAIWVFRDHIGKHLAAWWNKHHGEHAIEQHLEALRRHEKEKRDHS
jgi:hypothetical protein